jgi:hypothetical protein
MNSSKKILRFVAVLFMLAILIIGWQVAIYYRHRGLTSVKVAVVPDDSHLTVDGRATKQGTLYLSPGSHKLVASRPLFENDVKNINTADVSPQQTIYLLPTPNSAEAKAWLAQHPEIQREREAAGGAEAQRVQQLLIKKYPITSKLPHETLHYKIDYSLGSNQELSLVITTFGIINRPSEYPQYVEQTKEYKQEALDFLKLNGVNPSTYPITYVPNL